MTETNYENNNNNNVLLSKSYDWTESEFESDFFPENKKKKLSKENDSSPVICHICKQNILDPNTKLFQGLKESALEEEAALTDDRLQLYCDGGFIPEIDIKPLHKITCFTVFDGEGHLCPFDTGLIENDQLIFFSGYIKPIYDDDPSPNNGVPAQELGPIVEWWISGYDGGNSFLIAFRTPYAEYILMESSSEYSSFMRIPKQKALLTKIVIEFLNNTSKPTFEELLNRLNEVSVPDDIEPFDELSICKNAQFIIDQVREVDSNKKLISTPAIQDMIKKYKINIGKLDYGRKRFGYKSIFKTTTTTTPLVRNHFKFFFDKENGLSDKTAKKINSIDDSSPKKIIKFSWEKNSNFALVNDEIFHVKDFVEINTNQSVKENKVFRIERFFEQNFTKKVHCIEFIKGSETILGNACDPFEIFYIEECSDWPICKITKKLNVEIRKPPSTWDQYLNYQPTPSQNVFFIQKKYLEAYGTFEDYEENSSSECSVCNKKLKEEKATAITTFGQKVHDSGIILYEKIVRTNEEYVPGCCVFLEPFSVVFEAQKSSLRIEKTLVTIKANEVIYPEIYRKAKEINLTEECPEPFVVAYVENIFSLVGGSQKNLFLTVKLFYRPENTRVIKAGDERLFDLQLLYWSEEEVKVSLDHVQGRCNVIHSEFPPQVNSKIQFYFHSGFNFANETFYKVQNVVIRNAEENVKDVKKLKTLNAFSGCGGLAEGLRQSGIADIVWAIDIDKPTSEAFKLNFSNIVMFESDCNFFLKEVLSGKTFDKDGNRYPEKGEVEFLCGGPPCQGFSTMNRFTTKEESQYNNSLIITYLSFCDYYRPKFFLLENVKNFLSFKKSLFFKHVLSCLVTMGYQCSFGVLQAGNYGLPQSRRRLFILAAAPGYQLPFFPKPTHVFYGLLKNFDSEMNYTNFRCRFSKTLSPSAPFRNVTVRDAIFDLPPVGKTSNKNFSSSPTSYQRFLKTSSYSVHDHITKEISPLNEARIRHIPASKGCDWRDLPNIQVRLRDGTLTNLLKYSYHDRKNGKSCCGLLRGVCSCASGKSCTPKARQNNTLIPWFLAHTANRNNNWSGLYGRLDWDGVFNTVTTNPEPSNQQGKVLHPEEDRIITIRESARAQGMPDSFKFYGAVADKFRQVGNAVPPPIARAIGHEILKSLILEEKFSDCDG